MLKITGLLMFISIMIFTSCAQNAPKQNLGTLLGGAAGALAGSQFGKGRGKLIAVGLGTLLGASIGSEIGRNMDELDKLKMQETAGIAFEKSPDHQPVEWNNPNTGNSGSTVPTKTYYTESNTPCREYQTLVNIGGRKESAYGTACRQPDGSWKIMQ